jgi:hypothetical protein
MMLLATTNNSMLCSSHQGDNANYWLESLQMQMLASSFPFSTSTVPVPAMFDWSC